MAAILKVSFPTAGSQLAELISEFSWIDTALGPMSAWPAELKSTVALILRSIVPMATMWGETGVMIYNDAYAELAGAKHPSLLGQEVRSGWPEAADFNDKVMRAVLAGNNLAYRGQELTLARKGQPVQAWFDLDYSPISGEDGTPIGVLAVVIETTEKVQAARWRDSERDRLRYMFEHAPGFIAMMRGPDHVFELVNQAYLRLVGNRDVIEKTAREAYPDLEGQGFFELLDQVYSTGVPYVASAIPITFQTEPGGPLQKRAIDLIYQPVRDPEGEIVGVFAQGSDVTDRVETEQALKAAEQQSRQIIDSVIGYAIIALDLDGKILRWNDGAGRTFGWTEAEVSGLYWDMLFTPEDRAVGKPKEAMDAALEFGEAHHDRWHLRKSGEKFWARGEIRPLRDGAGNAIGLVKVLRDRTAEHMAGEALKEAEARLQRAQQAGGVGVFSLNLEDNILTPTPEFCKVYGLKEVGAIPISVIQDLVIGEDQDVASNPETRRDGSSPLNVEYHIRRADTGDIRIIARRGEFERDEQGNPVRFVGVVQDVTERRKSQQELRDSEARFRALMQALPNHVWTARQDGQLDWFNERVLEYSGLTQGELTGEGWAQMVHPDDLSSTAAKWAEALAEGRTYETEFRLRNRDGHYRWHIVRAVPVRDDRSAVLRWIGTNTDIEDQRLARAKLEELTETLEQRVAERTADRDRMWRLSTDIMLVANFEATISAINPAWTSILGWNEGDLIGKSFMELIHPDDFDTTMQEVGKLGQGVTTFKFVNRYQAKDGGYRVISWTAVPDERFIHAVGRDITEEQEAAAALKKTELALQQAQKMEAIGNLTGGVAHDFNNLLQVVAGNLQLLSGDLTGNEKALRRVTNALEGVNRGAKLASQLLAFGRRQALDPRVVNVGRLVRGMDDMLRRTIGEGVEVESIVSGGLWNTLVDPMQIENALLNLAINARDAMEGFGKLTIEVGNSYLDDTYARLHDDVEPGQYVVISVTDTGSGMSPEVMQKVFEPFFSTKPEGKGTGLGLSMVYGFVKQTGGHVKIYSELGLGTTIKMYLPRSVQQEDLEVVRSDMNVEGGQETILVAEDDEGVRATVVELLQELGYRVLKAPDAASALTIIESGMAIDLLFTDVVMPGSLKSSELARKAKERMQHIGVLFTSGYTENSIVHGGRLDPGVQLLSKPYSREQLAHKIRHVLNNSKQEDIAAAHLATETGSHETKTREREEFEAVSVLLVEDEPLIRMSAMDMLEEAGHIAREAGSAEEALALLEQELADVVLTDLGLPGMSGEDFCREVRQRWPKVAIIFATGMNAGPALADNSRTALLRKPYSPDEMLAAIECVLKEL
ncbi:PAS domain S-box protein [Neorhizobium sp. DAR64861/K0K2]|uniref:hybrid sensor histidine kinase/response regulator n=1 Tax=unclassified Neorhizobium TaxID=2629175 RepID=UPI003D29D9C8